MDANELVPTVDLSRPTDHELAAVDRACSDHGFFLLRGHGADDVIERVWREADGFFRSDRSERVAVQRDLDNPLGWFDRELTKRRRDHKQVFDYIDPMEPAADVFNRWPAADRFPAFRPTLAEFYDTFSELAARTVALVHDALGLSREVAARHVGDRTNSSVRLNQYPVGDPVPADERGELRELGETALGWHTDPGVLTLLVQDDTGGLEARTRSGEWIPVPPHPGTVVVNLADAMQVWTNDRYRAAVHRVVTMTERDRMSVPYFFNPSRTAEIGPIDELGADPRYRTFLWRDFMRARTDDNFSDLGADDTQISDYLLV